MRTSLALEEVAVFPIVSERFPDGRPKVVPTMQCHDGFLMSVQASADHHCTPQDDEGPWIEFEVSADGSESLLSPYMSEGIDDDQFIFTNVPIDIIRKVIDKHGGIVLDGQTYTYTQTSGEPIEASLSRYMMSPSMRAFVAVQEILRSVNHLDKGCDQIPCHRCSYFKSAISGNERHRVGHRAFCPFTASTHKSILSVSNDSERAEIIGELLDLIKETPKELKAEDL